MRLLSGDVRTQIFEKPVYTKVKDSVPAQYGTGAQVSNSIISDGCTIEGTVINSILSRGVIIGKGATVRDSIIMQNTEVMKNVTLNNVILDKRRHRSGKPPAGRSRNLSGGDRKEKQSSDSENTFN